MRQNGLRASSFVPIADVDPRIADQLLDLLAFAHVAAYAEPTPGLTGVYRDHHVPARPLDRLWVDRSARATARQVLDRSLAHLQADLETAIAEGTVATTGSAGPAAGPGRAERDGSTTGYGSPDGDRGSHGDDLDEDTVSSRWEQIIGGWDGPAAPEPIRRAGGPEPGAESSITGGPGIGGGPGVSGAPGPSGAPGGRIAATSGSERSAGSLDWAGAMPARRAFIDLPGRFARNAGTIGAHAAGPRDRIAAAGDEHYRPPAPPRHAPLEAVTRLGWAGVVGGPILLVLVVAFGNYLPTWMPLLGVALLVGGFALLVSRLHRSAVEPDDDDSDDGAIV